MVKELEGKNEFYYLDPTYIKYFVTKKKTLGEQEKLITMRHLIWDFTNKVFGENTNLFTLSGYRIGYLENFGYYLISKGDRGFYNIDNFGLDEKTAFQKIISELLLPLALDFEQQNRRQLQENFAQRFSSLNLEYHPDLYFAEYALNLLRKYYVDKIPADIILTYENDLNKNNPQLIWQYNLQTHEFTCTKKINLTLKKDN